MKKVLWDWDLDEPEAVDGGVEAVGDVAKVCPEVVEAVTNFLSGNY
jgi:hypothetical protein